MTLVFTAVKTNSKARTGACQTRQTSPVSGISIQCPTPERAGLPRDSLPYAGLSCRGRQAAHKAQISARV
ncbi:Uncharacterised protein [Mycobacteroides abscessus subsp. massiliense]|nr:Uncharacterised protein [Mycobacteroides abscessus subsp. massiliense]SKF43420.1 Uncharacterised protein [Mycobacteroides abscessus subsp. massiliense]SKF45028.1 Uncharacterised protein [Mycobacteroides abscessus subsp. massiliense]SKF47926.1 Uncharacterised protein [Mycobacteroides abscessus subsp. massiliense]SKF50428.1 Uncharacterised protein [Mycobacteroides abscessus subsp. massiliense]